MCQCWELNPEMRPVIQRIWELVKEEQRRAKRQQQPQQMFSGKTDLRSGGVDNTVSAYQSATYGRPDQQQQQQYQPEEYLSKGQVAPSPSSTPSAYQSPTYGTGGQQQYQPEEYLSKAIPQSLPSDYQPPTYGASSREPYQSLPQSISAAYQSSTYGTSSREQYQPEENLSKGQVIQSPPPSISAAYQSPAYGTSSREQYQPEGHLSNAPLPSPTIPAYQPPPSGTSGRQSYQPEENLVKEQSFTTLSSYQSPTYEGTADQQAYAGNNTWQPQQLQTQQRGASDVRPSWSPEPLQASDSTQRASTTTVSTPDSFSYSSAPPIGRFSNDIPSTPVLVPSLPSTQQQSRDATLPSYTQTKSSPMTPIDDKQLQHPQPTTLANDQSRSLSSSRDDPTTASISEPLPKQVTPTATPSSAPASAPASASSSTAPSSSSSSSSSPSSSASPSFFQKLLSPSAPSPVGILDPLPPSPAGSKHVKPTPSSSLDQDERSPSELEPLSAPPATKQQQPVAAPIPQKPTSAPPTTAAATTKAPSSTPQTPKSGGFLASLFGPAPQVPECKSLCFSIQK